MKYVISLTLLLSSLSAHADQVNVKTWADNSEYALYSLVVADMLQTRQIRDRDDLYEKSAYLCGKNPEDACIAAWFGAKLAGVWWLNNKAGWSDMRRYKVNMFLNIWTLKAVRSNLELGLEIRF